ncbi:MAG: glycosyltransferase [Rhodobacteraceae bacterium]|nr:glycosyltransferase [Paracoccaceae bacterium]
MTASPDHRHLAALVVTFNRCARLRTTVGRLLESPSGTLSRVLVVDNASTDQTAPWLRAQSDPRLEILRLDANRGGAGGFEAGLRHMIDTGTEEWIVLMDDDGWPAPGCLEQFVTAPPAGVAAVAAAVYLPSGQIAEMNRPSCNPFWNPQIFFRALAKGRRGFHIPDHAYAKGAGLARIDAASFVGLFVSRRGIEAAGYPDGRLFLYGEDVFFTLALRRAGFDIGFDPRLRFTHDCATPDGTDNGCIRPLWKIYFLRRNQTILYRAVAGPIMFWPIILVFLLKWRRDAHRYGAERSAYRRVLSQALGDGLRRRTSRTPAEIQALIDAP